MNHAQFWGGGGAAPYEIEQSLRFDESARLTRSAFGSTTLNTTWTLSCWFKRGGDDPDEYLAYHLFWAQAPGGSTNTGSVSIQNDPRYTSRLMTISSIYSDTTNVDPPGTVRDHAGWYHLVIKSVGTTGNQANISYYMNGELRLTTSNTPEAYFFGYPRTPYIGGTSTVGTYGGGFLGYMAEVHYIHGTAKNHTDFGELDDNGVWRPIEYTGGSYGTNGFYLKFDPSATNGIGHDHSGNGNNFTPSGFDTTNTTASTYDVMSDTPTTNWCTLNPALKNLNTGNTYTEGNLVATNGTGGYSFIFNSTIAVSSGKWYAECTMSGYSGTPSPTIGVRDAGNKKDVGNELVGTETGDVGYALRDGKIYKDGNYNYASYTTATSGDTIGIKLDLDSNTIEFLKNNTSVGSAVPIATGTGLKVFAGGQGDGQNGIGCVFTWNFGQRAFAYTPPTGFNALNTANLPAPDIADGSQYFNTKTYTGNGTTQTISNVNFQPDLVWVKSRSQTINHLLFDAVRGFGSGKELSSDNQNQEGGMSTNLYGYVSGVNSTSGGSFTVAAGTSGANYVNVSSQTYVAWNWDAGGSGSSIAAGSIDGTNPTIASTVSANPTAGFSIVTYAGSGTGGDSIAHGLGVPPQLIIAKSRGGGPYPTASWAVYHESIGASKWLVLDTTAAAAGPYSNPGTFWYNTAPTSTVFYVGNLNETNGSNDYVAYCFAEVEGYSKFGSYASNNSSDGPFVYCGFKPSLVVVKSLDGHGGWMMYDTARMSFNPGGDASTAYPLSADRSNAESSFWNAYQFDILSNGFKLRSNQGDVNYSGYYIFMALAENPFGGSGVSPATAR